MRQGGSLPLLGLKYDFSSEISAKDLVGRPSGEAKQRSEFVWRACPGQDCGDQGSAGKAPAGPSRGPQPRCDTRPAVTRPAVTPPSGGGRGQPEGVAVPGTDLESVAADSGEVKRPPGKLLPPTETPSRVFGSAVKQWARESLVQRQPTSKAFFCYQAITSKQNRGSPKLSLTCSGSRGVALHCGQVAFASQRRWSCLQSQPCPDFFFFFFSRGNRAVTRSLAGRVKFPSL